MKIGELTGLALDWAVAECEGKTDGPYILHDEFYWDNQGLEWAEDYSPSTNWAQGGPIIEREKIELCKSNPLYFPKRNEKGEYFEDLWIAENQHGQTPLIAAMRCYVAHKLGSEIEIPNNIRQKEQRDRK